MYKIAFRSRQILRSHRLKNRFNRLKSSTIFQTSTLFPSASVSFCVRLLYFESICFILCLSVSFCVICFILCPSASLCVRLFHFCVRLFQMDLWQCAEQAVPGKTGGEIYLRNDLHFCAVYAVWTRTGELANP